MATNRRDDECSRRVADYQRRGSEDEHVQAIDISGDETQGIAVEELQGGRTAAVQTGRRERIYRREYMIVCGAGYKINDLFIEQ